MGLVPRPALLSHLPLPCVESGFYFLKALLGLETKQGDFSVPQRRAP